MTAEMRPGLNGAEVIEQESGIEESTPDLSEIGKLRSSTNFGGNRVNRVF